MNLRNLSDQELLIKIEQLNIEEKNLLTVILHHLREIEARRLFSSLGYRSLFDYTVKKLGYSEDQAMRRIAAVRLLKELPEIEEKISDGALTLSNLGRAQSLFQKEKKWGVALDSAEKLRLLADLENKSAREADKIVLQRSSAPEKFVLDKVRPITAELSEVKFAADENLLAKIEKLKGLLAHSHPQISMAELLHKLCDLGIEEWDKGTDAKRPATSQKQCVNNPAATSKQNSKPLQKITVKQEVILNLSERVSNRRKAIPRPLQRQIWQKAKSKCENCGANYALQIDHILPIALGGENITDNLRLLCRSCNQRAAIGRFGQQKMQNFL